MSKEYWLQLKEEYSIPLPKNPTDLEAMEWAEKVRKQSTDLISDYGEVSWNIHDFMELCRADKISESCFRELVRYEIDKFRKNGK